LLTTQPTFHAAESTFHLTQLPLRNPHSISRTAQFRSRNTQNRSLDTFFEKTFTQNHNKIANSAPIPSLFQNI